jgi:hypothetical protein
VIVDQHIATLGERRQRKDTPDVTACDDPRRPDHALIVDGADEADLIAACEPDRRANGEGGGGGEAG